MKKFVIIFLAMLITFLCLSTASFANGIVAGDTVSNTARISASNAGSVTATQVDTVVAAIYGETTADAINPTSHQNTILVGGTAVIVYRVTNTGNSSDSFTVNIGDLQYAGGASGWTHTLLNSLGTSQGQSFIIGPIAEEGSETFAVRIVSSESIALSPNASQGYCTVAISGYAKTLTTEYTGDNDTVYARSNTSTTWTDSALISAAVFTLTKVCTGATLAGAADYPRPGAKLWYSVSYNNTGSAAGLNVYLYDEIDTAVSFDTAIGGSASGWTIYYSTTVAPVPVFGVSGDWTTTVPDRSLIRWVKWDKASVSAAENENICYTVIIK